MLTTPEAGYRSVKKIPEQRRATVLVVDDSRDTRDLLTFIIEARGLRVIQATDGQDAIDRALQDPPDLILMDVQLPVLNGLEASRKILEYPNLKHIPIIAITGLPDVDCEDALKAGCVDCIKKPIDPELFSKIFGWFSSGM
jgi:two-component system, cell cycle response regulator DivK